MEFNKYPYNEMSFAPEDQEECIKFVAYLMKMDMKGRYNNITILSDGYCTIVRWIQRPYDDSYGGCFDYVEAE